MAGTVPPSTVWAQRKDIVYVTFRLSDVQNPKITLSESSVSFSGQANKVDYAVTLDLFEDIVPEDSKQRITPFEVSLILKKKDTESHYWPRLRKEKAKAHFLKVDFNRWRDSDDSDEGGLDDAGFDAMANLGMGGGPMGSMEDFEDSDDSDAGDLPDLTAEQMEVEKSAESSETTEASGDASTS